MADDVSGTSQNTALRDKFVSVVGPVFEGGEEANILTLLTSLANVCRHDEGLVVTAPDTTTNVNEVNGHKSSKALESDKTSEFTCWLIAELVTVEGSETVNKANVNLQVTIMRILATRSPLLFSRVMADYINIGLEGKEVLFEGGTVVCQCFSSVIRRNDAHPVPKTITFVDDSKLDCILTTVVMVLSHLGSFIDQYCWQMMDRVWLLICSCLEGGDEKLKVAALGAVTILLDSCSVPQSNERLDYLLQCVGALLSSVLEDTGSGENTEKIIKDLSGTHQENVQKETDNTLPEHLAKVIHVLLQHIPSMLPIFQEEMLQKTSVCLQKAEGLKKLSETLRAELLKCHCVLFDALASSPCVQDAQEAMYLCAEENIMLKEVSKYILKRIVVRDLLEALPSHAVQSHQEVSRSQSRKRRLSETESTQPTISVVTISKLWKQALQTMGNVLSDWTDGTSALDLDHVKALGEIICTAGRVITNIPNAQVTLQFFPDSWVTVAADSLATIMAEADNVNFVMCLMETVSYMTWTGSVAESSNKKPQNNHIWMALATLPWMASEVSLLDLKPPNTKQYTSWASRLKWGNDSRVKAISISIIAMMPEDIAPKWRCHIMRAAINERDSVVMHEVARWFPVMVHQLGGAGGQQLVGEVIGAVLHFPDNKTVQAGAASLSHLLCALLNHTTVKCPKSEEDTYGPNILVCRVCKNANSTNNLDPQRVDPTLVSRFLGLLTHSDAKVLVAIIDALPAVITHTKLNPHMINQYLSLLDHQDKQVVSAMCRQLSELVCQGVQSDSSQDLKSAVVSKEGELVLSYLNELFRTAERKKSSSKTYLAVLEALHYLVRCPLGGLTGGVLVLLLRCLAISDRLVTAQAHLIIHSLANALGLPLKDLYIRHRQSLAQVLSEIVRPGEVGAMLSHVAEVFEWNISSTGSTKNQGKSSVGQFIISQIRHLLPALAVRATQEAKPGLLQELAGCLSLRLRDILIDHFQHILAFLVFHYPQEEQEAVLDFIASTTDIHIQNIRRCSVQNQVNELILGLHDHRDAVLREFSRMRAIEQSSDHNTSSRLTRKNTMENKFSHDPATSRDIAEYLAPRLLGILGFLDSKLVSSSTMYKEKRCALWSLSDLLVVMGRQYISPVSRKILASLKTALKLRDDEFFDIGCSAWTNFLYNLDESTLEGLLEEVAVVVKPLVKERPQQMAPVLTSVLVEMPSIRPLLGNLPLLPEDPALTQVNQAILERQTRVMGGSREEVVGALSPVLRGLSHESLDVRLHALNRLRHILRHNQEAVHHLTTDADTVHPTVSELFSILLGQCREVEEEVQVAVADCLGLLGAIDPMRLYTHSNIKEELSKIHLNIEGELFIVELVTELGRAFLAATDANTQTCASYAMQEVTRVYGIRERGSEGATPVGSGAWDRLPYQMQEIIFPLMTSKYTVANSNSRSTSGRPSPIYGSSRAQTFHQWLTNWTCSLIDLLKGERAFQVFSACKPILRRDTTTAMYLLQPVLVCALRESEQHHETILKEVLAVMKHMDEKPVAEQPSTISLELQHLAVQTLFTALDYVSKWIQKQRQIENASKKGRGAFTPSMELQQVTGFLEKIPANLLAQTSFKCQAYHRALLHIEAFLKDNPSQLKEHLGFMQRIYVSLDEPDGVAGVAAIRQEDPSLDEQVIQHVATGRLQDALGCYEHLCVRQGSEEVYKGLLDCYLSLDQPHSVLNITHGLLSNKPELEASLNEYRVEAAWRLGKWDCLEKYLETNPNQNSWGSGVGQVLLAVRARDSAAYQSSLRRLRTLQIAPLSAASMEKWAYQRAYPNILRLHILTELEEMVSGLLQFNQPTDTKIRFSSPELKMTLDHQQQPLNLQELVERWDKRLSLVQTSHRYLEPILSFRRTLLELGREWTQKSDSSLSSSLVTRLESTWLHSAKVARKAGHTQQGEWALLGAGSGRDVFIERAKWHWVKGEQHQAVTTLNRGMEKFFSSSDDYRGDTGKETQEERIAYGRAKLLLARYSEESATQEVNTIKQYYRDACEMNKQWEDGHFHLAMYYDRILSSLDVKEKPVEWIHHIVLSFGKSLQYGCRHIYQSMPRMLGLWLEFGTRVSELEAKEEKSRVSRKNTPLDSHREKLANLNGAVGSLVDRLPHYMFMTALPQLISRICHSNNEVFVQLCKIIATMLSSYPQQAMWHMIAVSKSSYPMRVSRCIEIFETAKRKNPDLHKFIADATKLADKFLELSNKHVEKGVPQVSLNSLLRGLPRLLSDTSFSSIILPLQQQMTVTTPVSSDALHSHNPFPRAEVFLASIEDQVEIMQSLQLPKKITLRGSDGNRYIMMCKPKDDLRKDCRLMEFNAFVNRCLVQDPESRRRDLHIRTYAVVPLNEECGLIEWIQNLNGLRQILHRIYRDTGIYMSGQELKQNMCKIDTPLATKRDIFKNKLVPRHPPVFGEWFLRNFPDPQAWLRARLSYCRTTAVMSMVGYILGLGDRHGENILFDSSNGDTVHVDFNCLFNKGETFDWPERVPFRLTHNMISAMGPTGYEGIFRKTCEVTMRVMRDERDALMSILRPFIHDPLVEWSRGDKSAKNTGEINNEKAQMHVSNIEHRLSGQIRTKGRGLNLPLSVEGQVNSLIEEATSVDNLCQMYIGWAAYM